MTQRRRRSRVIDARSARPEPSRVAIVGGGCAGLAAAFELSRPEHAGRYAITVYQMGFRLGGKGASGRGVGGRIEEHGLHLWMGFYENAFRLMRECYAELGRDPFRSPIATWQDAFKPAPWVAVTERAADGGWEPWVAKFPPGKGLPGDPLEQDSPFTIGAYLSKAVALLVELLRSAEAPGTPAPPPPEADARSSPERLIGAIDWIVRHGQLATFAGLAQAMQLLQVALDVLPLTPEASSGPVQGLVDAIAMAARRQLEMVTRGDVSLRRTFIVIDLILAIIRGSIAHGLALDPRGFDAIDDYDWREWLQKHGASRRALDSGFLRGIYDLAFAYEAGDPDRPALSAAAALRGAMRMFFTYRGSLFWRMSAGMGDIVFAPLYEVLKKRGVRFEFFHRLTDVQISDEREPSAHVTALCFNVQAKVRNGAEYRPLVSVHGLPCWPSEPNYAQLLDGARMRREGWLYESPWEKRSAEERVFRVGKDFDLAVLALGGGAIPMVCRRLIARSSKWKDMAEHLHTVATQAFQIWMTKDASELGWRAPQINLSGWVEPFDTWADMSHLILAESSQLAIKSIAYFCSPLPDLPEGHPAREEAVHADQYAVVRANAVHMLNREIAALWPEAVTARGFRWDLLAVESPPLRSQKGEKRFDSQFWTANVRPSERYTLTLPGGQKHRLSPLDRSFDNLTVAGDWTESGLNTGCVESAVMSGRLAAHALSGSPFLEDIVGYDHP
jgi:uncharacterized protein with NAD-binding domain and iron-sulfur cluster